MIECIQRPGDTIFVPQVCVMAGKRMASSVAEVYRMRGLSCEETRTSQCVWMMASPQATQQVNVRGLPRILGFFLTVCICSPWG